MVSESSYGTESSSMEEEASTSGTEEREEAPAEITEPVAPETKAPQRKAGGRRAALRIVREGVERVSKELGTFRKAHDASSKRLEKQIAALRSDISALKSHVAKETAKAREKQDATLAKVLSKLSAPKAAKKSAGKKVKPKKSKGKK
jgi:hypothetical protein